jgi:dipeptidyl aminopeptidase/acylaminoacyl peptidase
MKRTASISIIFSVLTVALLIVFITVYNPPNNPDPAKEPASLEEEKGQRDDIATTSQEKENDVSHPMFIKELRARSYPGGELTIEERLPDGSNYERYIASYRSEGLKINGLLTIPDSPKPENGYPSVVFIHGYIPPDQYSTTESYPTYQGYPARSGFITFKPDLRGHDRSEGEPVSAHFSEKYVVDTMNAISALEEYEKTDPDRIGYWGHSNGGEIGLRIITISPNIKAAVFWAGVVGSYEDMLETYNADIPFLKDADHELIRENGLPSENPEFWNKLDPYSYLSSISAPVQLHHGTEDESVPIELSLSLKEALEEIDKPVEYFEYPGDDHNIGNNTGTAWQRSIEFLRDNLED